MSQLFADIFNGDNNYIPKFNVTNGDTKLVNSVIYQDSDGHVGINVQPDPEHVFEIFDDRTNDASGQHSIYLTTYASATPGSGAGGILARVSEDSGVTFDRIAMVPGTTSSDWMTSNRTAFYSNSDLNTSSATGYSGQITHDGTNPHWILGGTVTETTTHTLKVNGTSEFTDNIEVTGGISLSGALTLNKSVTLTATQVLSLSGGGSNIELIAAPGANKVIDVISLIAYLDFGTQAYNWIGTGNKLSITTTTPVSQENGFNLAATQLNASADTYWKPEIANVPIGVNLPLSIYNTSGGVVTQGDSPITFNILYRIVDFS